MADFRLRQELHGHEEDVRAVCVTPEGALLTGSRDKTIKLWREGEDGAYVEDKTLVGHTDFVSAVAYAAPGLLEGCPGGAVVSGSRDTTVMVWDLQSATPVQRLEGHQYQVTAVLVTPEGDIVSASLDKTIRIWRGGQCVQVLEGHEAAVLCLLQLPNGDLLSGSGDCTIRVWSGGKCTHTIPAHSDSVRGLALFPNVGVVSASHDQTLKVWTLAGECVAELVGHTALVYCAACTFDGLVASGSEDNTAKLWHADGTCLQTLEHPSNLWGVAFLPNGDLVTACSDHVARIWTQAADRAAPAEIAQAYDAALAAKKEAAAATKQESGCGGGGGGGLPAGLKLEDPAVLLQPGTRDGQQKYVRKGGTCWVYAWDAAKAEWDKIGEVVGGDDTMVAGSKWHNGQQWDYVFDVDAEEGAPPRKLALNRGDNPYLVADRWLEEQGLPATYKEQIVQFILQNTAADTGPSGSRFVDPYTGAAAYVPPAPGGSGGAPGGGHASGSTDPYTGVGAYVPPASSGAGGEGKYGVTGGGADPYTGGGAAPTRHLPAKSYLIYDQVPARDAIRKKIAEFSAAVAASGGDAAAAALSNAELADGGALDALLSRAAAAPSSSGSGCLADADAAVLSKMLSWPAAQLFPALDLARLLVLHRAAAEQLAGAAGPLASDAPRGGLGSALATACAGEPPVPAAQQTAVRLACNCFVQPPLLGWVQSAGSRVLDAFAPCATSPNKNVRQGLATLLVNYAVMLSKLASHELEFKSRMLGLAVELLNSSPVDDVETRYRTLVAVGTLAAEHSKVRAMARDLGFLSLADSLRAGGGGKVAEAAAEVAAKLRL
ncbi:phospholipase A-2-activating [Chlorella sorokiniana]|uniref:Phospholipase A-2-activating n=1 Tax=Chlorella sorokiniana TaxID=3076 RepID=A0A2P6TJZ6_CHLSO|nr:phospholipase A-2-activating [Chlorella sorokiniana]|eukprot:PRW44412.1 phospholipase A-2-activating [Chlorella sorokiniana]